MCLSDSPHIFIYLALYPLAYGDVRHMNLVMEMLLCCAVGGSVHERHDSRALAVHLELRHYEGAKFIFF